MIKERSDKKCGKAANLGWGLLFAFLRDILAQATVAQAACSLLAAPSAGCFREDCCYIPRLAEGKSYPDLLQLLSPRQNGPSSPH